MYTVSGKEGENFDAKKPKTAQTTTAQNPSDEGQEDMAEKTGLAAGTPICGGAGDTMQSMLGSGNMGAGQAVDVAGTCSLF